MIKLDLDPINGVKAEARCLAMIYCLQTKQVLISTEVVPVDDEGNEIQSALFSKYRVELVANEHVMVNPTTGEVIVLPAPIIDPETGNITNEQELQYPPDAISEYAFFRKIAKNVPVKVDELILQAMQKAKEAGRFIK